MITDIEKEHVVVDIETLDNTPTSTVVSVGLVKVVPAERDSWQSLGNTYYAVLNMDEQNRTISQGTVDWWKEQSDEARSVFEEPTISTKTFMEEMDAFCSGTVALWGNGNVFDNVILRDLYRDFDRQFPYPFWKDFDLRTAKMYAEAVGYTMPTIPKHVKHNALDDAKAEALMLQAYTHALMSKAAA